MIPRWTFHQHQPSARVRDPIQGEFFASESIDGPAEALVREAIQNAMDARGSLDTPVHVRIFLSGAESALDGSKIGRYTGSDFWRHVAAPGNGLRTPPSPDEPCPFLVFEDFGTTGLSGDISQWKPVPDTSNGFFYFFRAEGLTDKREGKGGSWGVGKSVFPRSSRTNSMFGFTVRDMEPQRLLMGTLTLKTHDMDRVCYDPDAWFGTESAVEGHGVVMPVTSATLVDEFARDFCLSRGATDLGLSVVVPWPDPEITTEKLLSAAVRGWFYPVLKGVLEITIESPGQSFTIATDTLETHLARCPEPVQKEIAPLISLTRHLCSVDPSEYIKLSRPTAAQAPKWREELLTESVRARLRKELEGDLPVAIRVPITVRRKRPIQWLESHFDICMQRDPDSSGSRVTFLRGGIIVPEVKHGRARGVRAMVVAEDRPIAELLRDAEHPAHTHWSKDTSNFKEKYETGPSYLSFVQNSVSELLRLLQADETAEDPRLLVDFFSIPLLPEEEEATHEVTPGQRGGTKDAPPPPPPPPPPQPAPFRVTATSGGFTIRGVPGGRSVDGLKVRVAYDRRTKNPFKRWHPADFELDQAPIEFTERTGVTIRETAGNVLRLHVDDPSFALTMRGFDQNRDVIVDAREDEAGDQAH